MAKNKISEYSATAANNTDIGGINIAEGCAPSGINNAIRELMAQLKDQQVGTDGDNFTVGGAFTCTGAAVFSSTVAIAGASTIGGALNVGGASTIGGALNVGGALTASGNAVLSANVTLGTATTNTVTLNSATIVAPTELSISSTGAVKLPSGTTAQRPTGTAGQIRYNSTIPRYEGYVSGAWSALGGGATGGGTDTVFVENSQNVTVNYTITTNKNAMSAGDITINTGVTVTLPTGSRWVIV
jgi:hypothetical protein